MKVQASVFGCDFVNLSQKMQLWPLVLQMYSQQNCTCICFFLISLDVFREHKQIQGEKVMHLWNCSLGSVRPHLIGPQMIVSKPAPGGGKVEVEHLLLWRVYSFVVNE